MPDADLPLQISVEETRTLLDLGEPVHLLDVREPVEFEQAALAGAELVPLRTVPQNLERIQEVAREKRVIVYCHHGIRSLNAVVWLRQQGIAACQSMSGGIDHWSLHIDPSVPRYY